ncbi:unnamed protein product, partial [Prorocentrum cordatum]
ASEEADLSLPVEDREPDGSGGFGIVPAPVDDAHRRVSTMSTTSQGVKRHSTKSNRGTPAALPRLGLDAPAAEGAAPAGREPPRKSLTKAREAQMQALTATPLDTEVAAASSADRFSRVFADRRSSFRSNSSKSLESLPDRQWKRTFTADSRASSSAGPLLARLHEEEEEDAAGGPSQRPHAAKAPAPFDLTEDPPAIVVSPPLAELSSLRGAQCSPKGPTVKRGSRGGGEPEGRPQFSQLDEPVLYHKESPINFGTLAKRSPSSSSSSSGSGGENDGGDSDDSDGELWCSRGQGQVEVPIWLMEKLKSRGPPGLSAEERRLLDSAQERASRGSSGSAEAAGSSARVEPRPPRGSSFCAPAPELPGISEGEEEAGSPVGVRFEELEGAEAAKRRGGSSGRQPAPKTFGNAGSARTSRNDLAASQRASVRTTTAPVKPQNFFWKIPMPSRKNTVQTGAESLAHLPEEDGSDDEGGRDGAAASSSTGPVLLGSSTSAPPRGSLMRHVGFDEGAGGAAHAAARRPSQSRPGQQGAQRKTSLCLPGGGVPGAVGTLGQLQPPQKRHSRNLLSSNSVGSRGSRRPSALGVFSDGFRAGSSQGLYVLPRDPSASVGHEDSEIVEVRRESVVMSPTMMEGILKCKSLGSRLSQQLAEEVGTHGGEIVLPLFTQKKSNLPHQCTCQVDPLTGHVIHTCMTPKSTRCTNTEVMQSYVCSEWHSKVGTRTRGSFSEECAAFMGSRRGSFGDAPAAEQQPYDVHRKRIRNETVLGMMSRGPAPAKQNVEDDDDDDFEKPDGEEKADGPVGDQLVVSFSSIQNSQKGSHRESFCGDLRLLGGAGGAGSPAHGAGELDGAATPVGAAGMYGDAQVESELGHRFDLLEPEALGAMLLDVEGRERLLIVDVRGRDWVGGHIPSSINLRTSEVTTHPESLLAQCRQNRIQTVIFTCMYSVLRARKCATALEQVQNEEQKSGHAPYRLRVYLLRGGMHAWVNHYVGAELIAADPPEQFLVNFQPEMWSDGGPSQGGLVHVMDALWSSGGQKALTDALTQELSALAAMASRDNSSHTSTIHNSRRPSENDPAA